MRSMAGFMTQPALRPMARMIPETLAREDDIPAIYVESPETHEKRTRLLFP